MLSINTMEAQGNSFTVYAGYTGTFNDVESHGATASLVYDMPVFKGFSFMPEAGFDFRYVTDNEDKLFQFSLGASAAYTFRFPAVNLSLFTGPRMRVNIAHDDPEWLGGDAWHFNTVGVVWQFGLGFNYKHFAFRGTYALPLSDFGHYNYIDAFGNDGSGGPYRTNIYEISVGYRF